MIMSPRVLDRNVPLIGPPKGGQIGADGDEQEGVGKGGGAGAGAGEVRWGGGPALRADAGGGALGVRGWVAGRRRDAATLDAGRGAMEPRAQPAAAPTSARAQGALWGDGADGRELSSVAGGARPGRLLDRYGR